ASLGAYQGNGTTWRTCPSDAVEGAALTQLGSAVAVDVGAQRSHSPVALTIMHATDTESTELDAILAANLTLNGAPAEDASNAGVFANVAFGDPDPSTMPNSGFSAALSQVFTAPTPPDVVMILGQTQAVSGILRGLESSWPAQFPQRPIYVVSSGLQTT